MCCTYKAATKDVKEPSDVLKLLKVDNGTRLCIYA